MPGFAASNSGVSFCISIMWPLLTVAMVSSPAEALAVPKAARPSARPSAVACFLSKNMGFLPELGVHKRGPSTAHSSTGLCLHALIGPEGQRPGPALSGRPIILFCGFFTELAQNSAQSAKAEKERAKAQAIQSVQRRRKPARGIAKQTEGGLNRGRAVPRSGAGPEGASGATASRRMFALPAPQRTPSWSPPQRGGRNEGGKVAAAKPGGPSVENGQRGMRRRGGFASASEQTTSER